MRSKSSLSSMFVMFCVVFRLLFEDMRLYDTGISCIYWFNILVTSFNFLMLFIEDREFECELEFAIRLLARLSKEAFLNEPELEFLLMISRSDFSAIIIWKSKHLMLYLMALSPPAHSSSSSIWSSISKSESLLPGDPSSKIYCVIINFDNLCYVSISINCFRSSYGSCHTMLLGLEMYGIHSSFFLPSLWNRQLTACFLPLF